MPLPLILRIALLGMFLAIASSAVAAPAPAPAHAFLRVEGEIFILTLPDSKRLTSRDLVGAELETADGGVIRIDAVTPSKERPAIMLHRFSEFDPESKTWRPTCDTDAYGRQAGFPVAGSWDATGRYVKDPDKWFVACTGGSRGKCILWGYDPWAPGPKGEDLVPYYQACQFAARANYDGAGEAHTRNGTEIDLADLLGIQTHDSLANPHYIFEAGWGPQGAVCVAATRWPDLLTRDALLKMAPTLGGPCTEDDAIRRGALIFTRILRR